MEDILKYFLSHQAIAKHTGITTPQTIRTFTFISIMENKESYQNILLDNQETPIKITLSSTPEIKVTNKNSNSIDNNKNGPANDSHLKKMEEYISQQYDQAALTHLKNQIINEISKENCQNKLKNKVAGTYDIASALRSQIETLESEIYFLRGEIKEKNTLIKSLITPYTSHAEHTKQQINKEKRNTNKASSTIKAKENFSNSKETSQTDKNVISKKTPATDNIDFRVDKLVPTNDIPDSEHHVLLPFFDDDKEIPTEKYNPATTTLQNCIINDQNSFKSTETHNNNNLTPQNIDLVSNPPQVKKEKGVALNPDEWKKGITLVIGDSVLAGLRQTKLSRNKKIKVRFFLVQKMWLYNTIKLPTSRKSPIISSSISVLMAAPTNLKI